MRLTDLLAMAGGTATNGADRVVVTGTRDGQPFRQEVDLPALFGPGGREQGPAASSMATPSGSTASRMVYIYGEVQRPGALRLERGMTVMQALATGGGLTQRGTEKGLRVHRKAADGRIAVIEPTLDDSVQDGDVVFVRESLF